MSALIAPEAAASPRASTRGRYLFGPVVDFLALGGASLVLLPAVALLPSSTDRALVIVAIWVAFLINYPHFAVSYTIFYRDFRSKVGPDRSPGTDLHWRYRFAGIVVPVAIIAVLGGAIAAGRADVLGYGHNLMLLTVGWHYVKQGYGMAMVDGALKGSFFDDDEKALLRHNGYVAWAVAWMLLNRRAGADNFFGVPITRIAVPDAALRLAFVVLVVTSAVVAIVLARRVVSRRPTAWTGVAAYLISIYVWTVLRPVDIATMVVIPVLHSFQYLWVVARFQKNRAIAEPSAPSWRGSYAVAVVTGGLAFWVVPPLLDSIVPYDHDAITGSAFMVLFWIGINVHHYFLDNVMWRRGNPDVARHLFAHRG